MNRAKYFTRLIDSATGELIVSADLTPAATKRIVKEYSRFGYELTDENTFYIPNEAIDYLEEVQLMGLDQ